MIFLSFFVGLAILITAAAVCRRLFYAIWWGAPPSRIDEDPEDVAFGWFMGLLLGLLLLFVAALSICIGGLVVGATCGDHGAVTREGDLPGGSSESEANDD